MRRAPSIWEAWSRSDGRFIGDYKARTVVTVEKDWWLNLSPRNVGTSTRGPYRHFLCADDPPVETVIPNVKRVQTDRSTEAPAAQATIELYNQMIDLDNPITEIHGQIGRPGYFTWNRGESEDARARWGHEVNEWNDVLVPNALIRTWQGYCPDDKDWEEAREDGELILTGVWLVDTVNVSAKSGTISLSCRDMAKLLIDQIIYPPLNPNREDTHPLRYYRWQYTQADSAFGHRPPAPPPFEGAWPDHEVAVRYVTSSSDMWYGPNASIHGHRPTDMLDGNTSTFAMSVGNSHPSKLFCADWWTVRPVGPVEWVYINPWGGNYTMYVSVKENGVWQGGGGTIPYSPNELYGTQPHVVDTGANIPFVMQTAVPWEKPGWYRLPRQFNAQELRITFRNHTQTQHGPWFFRCGIRELKAGVGSESVSKAAKEHGLKGIATEPWVFSVASKPPTGEIPETTGYWCVDEAGKVFAFGDARVQEKNGGGPHDAYALAIRPHPDGEGYWVLLGNGRVQSYGSAEHFGDASDLGFDNFLALAPTPSGDGYFLLRRSGQVYAFGDAIHMGDATSSPCHPDHKGVGIATDPTSPTGYWIVDGEGRVFAYGLPSYGELTPPRQGFRSETEWVRGMVAHPEGGGYYIVSGSGRVYAFGSAEHFGEWDPGSLKDRLHEGNRFGFGLIVWDIAVQADGKGYWLQQANGMILRYGEASEWGHPGGNGIQRSPGNIEDYTDIVRELLLWSGWWLCRSNPPAGEKPEVYGNMEYTGAWPEEMGEDVFDKKPVIDAINTVKEIVGYLFMIDEEGAAHFESANWWKIGNFWEDGSYTDMVPEIDEQYLLTDYAVTFDGDGARSDVTISTQIPDESLDTTITTKHIPATSWLLRGMVRPAMWINQAFTSENEQRIMAELISMHIWFSMRTGSVTMAALPTLQINDQVRIWERTTSESYIHYVRGITTTHDLETGEYTMTLDTNWLGTEDDWVITAEEIPDDQKIRRIQISPLLQEHLERSHDRRIQTARIESGTQEVVTFVSDVVPDGPPGAADG